MVHEVVMNSVISPRVRSCVAPAGAAARLRRFAGWLVLAAGLAAAPALSADDSGAVALVKKTTGALIAGISGENASIRQDKERLYAFVDGEVAPHFDFLRFAKIISARHWRKFSDDQKRELQDGVRTRLVRTIATGLNQYDEQEIKFLPPRGKDKPGDEIVRTQIRQASGAVLNLGYRLYDQDGTWRIYDVILDGISMAKTYRSQLGNHVRQKGVESFLEVLTQ